MLDNREFEEEFDTCEDVEKVSPASQIIKDLGEAATDLGRWGAKQIVKEIKREISEAERSY